jgi:hypothetical protein
VIEINSTSRLWPKALFSVTLAMERQVGAILIVLGAIAADGFFSHLYIPY